MKKFVSTFISIIGAVMAVLMIYTIIHYGTVNMSRANESYIHWLSTGELR